MEKIALHLKSSGILLTSHCAPRCNVFGHRKPRESGSFLKKIRLYSLSLSRTPTAVWPHSFLDLWDGLPLNWIRTTRPVSRLQGAVLKVQLTNYIMQRPRHSVASSLAQEHAQVLP